MFRSLLLLLAAASLLLPGTSSARLTRLVITQTVPLAGGVGWGSTGPYERLTGTAYFEVDPNHARNAVIVDVDNAPRNSHGMVKFSTQFMIDRKSVVYGKSRVDGGQQGSVSATQ